MIYVSTAAPWLNMNAGKIVTHFLICLALAGSVYVTFSPVLRADFLQWDDRSYVTENEAVSAPLDGDGLARILTQKTTPQYVPLTVLSYAIDYRFGGDSPRVYHATNLFLHLLNVLLVYALALRLGLRPWAAALSALLFGVHPLRVETVAWVAQRRNLLFSFCFLLSFILYDYRLGGLLRGTGRFRQWVGLVGAHLFGLLGILAHPMALGLVPALLLLDWFRGRRLDAAALAEKIPLAVVLGGIAYITFASTVRGLSVPLGQGLLIAVWTSAYYLRQYLLPVGSVPIVRMPGPVSLSQPEYLLSLAVVLVVILALIRLRRDRWFRFACVFFACSLIFLIIFGSAKSLSFAADRFMYLPGLGFSLLAGRLGQWIYHETKGGRWLVICGRVTSIAGLAVTLWIFGILTFRQTYVWQNDIALWRHQLMSFPEEPVALNGLAVALLEQDDFQRAVDGYRQMVRVAAQGYELNLGQPELEQVRRVKYIVTLMRRAEASAPDLPNIPYRLGQYYQSLGLYVDAVAKFRRVVEIDPGFKEVYADLGEIYLDLKDLDKAALALKQYFTIPPVREADYLKVVETYAKYLRRQPDNVALQSGMFDVIKEYVTYANQQSLGADSYVNLGLIYLRAGDSEAAKQALGRALELNPHEIKALYALGVLLMDEGDRGAALKRFEQVVKQDKRHADALVRLGDIYYGRGDIQQARSYYRQAIGVAPRHAQAHFNLGYTYEEAGRLKEAVANYRLALRDDPDNAEAHFNLGNVYVQQDNLDEAIAQYRQTVRYNPDHMDAWVNLAVTSFNAGRVPEARKYLEEAELLGFEPPAEMKRRMGSVR